MFSISFSVDIITFCYCILKRKLSFQNVKKKSKWVKRNLEIFNLGVSAKIIVNSFGQCNLSLLIAVGDPCFLIADKITNTMFLFAT